MLCQAQSEERMPIPNVQTDTPYVKPNASDGTIKTWLISDLQDCLVSVQKWINSTYYYSRTVATEILVYMLNDLDRRYQMETNIAHPIAYAMKGTSLKGETFTAMIDHVINNCEKKGLSILTTSSDGQWHRYGVRGDDDKPLTVLQLQLDHWKNVKSKDKPSILSEMKMTYKVESLDHVKYEKVQNCGIIVHGHYADKPFVGKMQCSTVNRETEDEKGQLEHKSDIRRDGNEILANVCAGLLDESETGNMDNETYMKLQDVVHDAVSERSQYKTNTENEEQVFDLSQWLFADDEEEPIPSCSSAAPIIDDNTLDIIDNTTPTLDAFGCTSVLSNAFQALYYDDLDMTDTAVDTNYKVSGDLDEGFPKSIPIYSRLDDVGSNHTTEAELESQLSNIAINDTIPEAEKSEAITLKPEHFEQMLLNLQTNEKAQSIHNWKNKSVHDFTKIFRSKTACDKSLHKFEVCLCLEVLRCEFDAKLPKKTHRVHFEVKTRWRRSSIICYESTVCKT